LVPDLSVGIVVEVDSGSYTLSTLSANLLRSLVLSPDVGQIILTGYSPTIDGGLSVHPDGVTIYSIERTGLVIYSKEVVPPVIYSLN
jgi:hypothetical protein